jgi:hypothetical protein
MKILVTGGARPQRLRNLPANRLRSRRMQAGLVLRVGRADTQEFNYKHTEKEVKK